MDNELTLGAAPDIGAVERASAVRIKGRRTIHDVGGTESDEVALVGIRVVAADLL